MERIYFTDVGWLGVIQLPFERGGGQIEKDSIRQSFLKLIPPVKKLNMSFTIA